MKATILVGDCRERMAEMEPDSIDAIVTDPPYALTAGKKGGTGEASVTLANPYGRARITAGFMGQKWDGSIPGVDFWTAALRVAKPGAHLLAMGGTRTIHRLVCAIEDAGWEVRDMLCYLYGSGFPKSKNIGGGFGTALKPGWEGICLARKPLTGTVAANVQRFGTGGLNIDACRIGDGARTLNNYKSERGASVTALGTTHAGKVYESREIALGRWPANVLLDEWRDQVLCLRGNVNTDVARVVRLYFDQVQNLPASDSYISEPCEQEEVLQSQVLRGGPNKEDRAEVATLREAAHGRRQGEDVCNQESPQPQRTEVTELGGALQVPRVLDGQSSGREPSDSRTSSSTLEAPGSTPASVRGGSPSQRRQDGQQDSQPRAIGPRNTQAGALADREGAAEASPRERRLEVRASQIPQGWLDLFEPTGRSIRCGAAAMLDEQSGESVSRPHEGAQLSGSGTHEGWKRPAHTKEFPKWAPHSDSGGASRFFFTAKASAADRNDGLEGMPNQRITTLNAGVDGSLPRNRPNLPRANVHPTVKPFDLMRWLCRLVCPPNGTILDPFAGSGSTGVAALAESFNFIGIELEPTYAAIAERRIANVAPLLATVEAEKAEEKADQQLNLDITGAP